MQETDCVLCQVYFPGADLHAPDQLRTCAAGRNRLSRDRLSVLSMYRRLLEQEDEVVDSRLRAETEVPRDPVATMLPMAPTPSPSNKPSVSGSKERQLPINVSVVDLTSPAHPGAVSDPHGDQVGDLSVATVLHEWVAHWKHEFFGFEVAPPVTAVPLLEWIGPRLDELVEVEPAIADFAAELVELKSRLRHALGESAPKPIVMWGVPCRRCDTVSSLVLDPEDPDHYRECSNDACGLLLTEDEYKAWLLEIVEGLRRERDLREGADV